MREEEEERPRRKRPATLRETTRLIGLGAVHNPYLNRNTTRPRPRAPEPDVELEGVTVTAPRLSKEQRLARDIAIEGPIRLPRLPRLPSLDQVGQVAQPLSSLLMAVNPVAQFLPQAAQGREIIKEATGVPHLARTHERGVEALRRGDEAAASEIGNEVIGAGGNVALMAAPEVGLLARSMVAPRVAREAVREVGMAAPRRISASGPVRLRDYRSELGSDVYDSMSAAEREALRERGTRSGGYFSRTTPPRSPSGGYTGVRFGETINNRVRPRGRPRNVSGTPSEYVQKTYNRLLTEAENLARESRGGRLPSGYTEILAQRTGYAPEGIKQTLKRIRAGEHGDELRNRANTLGLGRSGQPNWQRAAVARLMDRGFRPAQIVERINAMRAARNLEPTSVDSIKTTTSLVRKRRRETGDPGAIAATIGSAAGAAGLSASEARAQEASEYDSAKNEVSRLEAGVRLIEETDQSSPAAIKKMQQFLKAQGVYTQQYVPDGVWARGTDTAVETYRGRLATARQNLTRLNQEREAASRRTRSTPGEQAFREIAPNASFWGGLALGLGSRGAATWFTNRGSKRAVREVNALLSASGKPLARNQAAAARRRMGRLTEFYVRGGERVPGGVNVPFVHSPRSKVGFKPNPAGVTPTDALFPLESGGGRLGAIRREYHLPDLLTIGGAGIDVGVSQAFLFDAERRLKEAEADLRRNPNSEDAMAKVRSILNEIAWAKMFRGVGGGIGLGHAGGALKLRYSRDRPDVGRANAELAELMAFLAPKKPKPKPKANP